jgi:hypothetical protein
MDPLYQQKDAELENLRQILPAAKLITPRNKNDKKT